MIAYIASANSQSGAAGLQAYVDKEQVRSSLHLALVFVVLSLVMILFPELHPIKPTWYLRLLGFAILLMSAWRVLVTVLMLFDRRIYLMIDDRGFYCRYSLKKPVPWTEVSSLKHHKPFNQSYLMVELKHPKKCTGGGFANLVLKIKIMFGSKGPTIDWVHLDCTAMDVLQALNDSCPELCLQDLKIT